MTTSPDLMTRSFAHSVTLCGQGTLMSQTLPAIQRQMP